MERWIGIGRKRDREVIGIGLEETENWLEERAKGEEREEEQRRERK